MTNPKSQSAAAPGSRPSLVEEQDAPLPNKRTPIWDLVMTDMQYLDAEGRRKYGTPLQAHNGRDALVDAYQEALDLVVYLRQAIEERAPNQRTAEPGAAGNK